MIFAHFLYNKSATLLFLIESHLFTKRGIEYQNMAAIFTDDPIHTFLQGDVQMAFPEATTYALDMAGIEHPRDPGEFPK